MFRNTFQEVVEELTHKDLKQCGEYLEDEIKHQIGLRDKFKWLEIPEQRLEDALVELEKPDCKKLLNELKEGKVIISK